MEGLISGPLKEVLKKERSYFNAKFAQTRLCFPALKAEVFKNYLHQMIYPLMQKVAKEDLSMVREVFRSLFDLCLPFMGKGFLGQQSRYPLLNQGFTELLGEFPEFLCSHPDAFPRSIFNALFNLSLAKSSRPETWLKRIKKMKAGTGDLQELLNAGKVAAWCSGLPQYRESAITLLTKLPPALGQIALGMQGNITDKEFDAVVKKITADPWYEPVKSANRKSWSEKKIRLLSVVDGFRGFGGSFIQPPEVSYAAGKFSVTDGEKNFILHADCFASLLVPSNSPGIFPVNKSLNTFKLQKNGCITYKSVVRTFQHFSNALSHACNEHTLAITMKNSHSIYLIGFCEDDFLILS
ncbi:hypothetical protein ACFL35_06455 [Candidatus Riflebacteria bacterium]